MRMSRKMDLVQKNIDLIWMVDAVWPDLSNMEAATALLIMYGYRQIEIAEHFEITKQAVHGYLNNVGKKMINIEPIAEGLRQYGYLRDIERRTG